MSKRVTESESSALFPTKPRTNLRIYAWAPVDPPAAYVGLIKIGQTTKADVNLRIRESQGQMQQSYHLLLDQSAELENGVIVRDSDIRKRLIEKGFKNPLVGSSREWVECSLADIKTVFTELAIGKRFSGTHHETFPMRPEQQDAVDQTVEYFQSVWEEDSNSVPRFLWNAKMRFGKTFASYQLAKRINAKNILVVTFKPAVEDAWRSDLESHVDFAEWRFATAIDKLHERPGAVDESFVYFGSFQDLLGRDRKTDLIKAKNEWVHRTEWDLVIFDEYHFGAWRESAKELFQGEDEKIAKRELATEFHASLSVFDEEFDEFGNDESEFLQINSRSFLYLSGTPFKALASGEFIEEQIFNWTYTDEQKAKRDFDLNHPGEPNPYAALPEMRVMTYQMPEEIIAVASQGEFNEFDLNEFFTAQGEGAEAYFVHKNEVQKWLDLIRGEHFATQINSLKNGSKPALPYSDTRLLPYLQHSFWFLPSVASCEAMANLLAERHNVFWHDYDVLTVAGPKAGIGSNALPPVREAIRDGHSTKTITLSCGKLTTGITVKQWSSILMLCNLNAPETYFQAAFRVQSPWSIKNPDGDDPQREHIYKPVCFVFDFAPTRALRQIADYGAGLAPNEPNPEKAVEKLVNFLPVLAYVGSDMTRIDAGEILDIAMAGTSGTLLARKWESAVLVNVDNETLRRLLGNKDALDAIMRIEGFRQLGESVFETIINKSEEVKKTKKKGDDLTDSEKKTLTEEEKEYKTQRKLVQKKLIKFATRIPAFMYLTDYRENTLQDVITKLESDLFKSVTGLSVEDFDLLVDLGVFNSMQMNQAVYAFRRYEDASLAYTGIDRREGVKRYGLYDTVVSEHDYAIDFDGGVAFDSLAAGTLTERGQ